MRTVSRHVQDVIRATPLLAEVISEGIGNNSAIARLIHKDIERRAMEKVSLQAIAMALHRLPQKERHTQFGFRFLKHITDITVRSNLTLYFVHNSPHEKRLFERLSAFEERYREIILGVTRGLSETLVIARGDASADMKRVLGNGPLRVQKNISSVSMHLPVASMPIPGVYYPILKALAWEGINVVELVSAGTEFTLFVEDKDVNLTLSTVRELMGARGR